MKVVVVGGGGRERALEWSLGQTAEVQLVSAKFDPLTDNIDADLFVVGPEQPLVDGLADTLRNQGKLVLGPGAEGAKLEGSKIWMKQLLTRAGIPTAGWGHYGGIAGVTDAVTVLDHFQKPWVIKTDYLMGGKGVLVTEDREAAVADIRAKLQNGGRIIIEDGLKGREMSFFALCSGESWVMLPFAQDYKRLLDGDKGPNTGGMGAFTPVPDQPRIEVLAPIVEATLRELRRRGIDFRGILYGGIMLTERGPMVLEYNIRLGDPETQAIVPTIKSDLANMFVRAAAGEGVYQPWVEGACVTVVLASRGYPQKPVTGDVITGIDEANDLDGVMVFHAGTERRDDGQFYTAGGRVLNVTARGQTVAEARKLAYEGVSRIKFNGMQYRTDIAA